MRSRPEAHISATKILIGALSVIPLRFPQFARVLAVPFLLYLAVDSLWLLPFAVDFYNSLLWPMFILTELIDVLLYTIAAVATHRLILLGASSTPRFGIEWGRHTSQFLLLAFAFTVSSYGFSFAFSWLVVQIQELGVLVLIAVLVVFSRLLLVFPAAAVGKPISLLESWRLTSNRKFLMTVIVFVYPALIWIPIQSLSNVSGIGYLLQSILSILGIIVTVILVSFAYQQTITDRAGAA